MSPVCDFKVKYCQLFTIIFNFCIIFAPEFKPNVTLS